MTAEINGKFVWQVKIAFVKHLDKPNGFKFDICSAVHFDYNRRLNVYNIPLNKCTSDYIIIKCYATNYNYIAINNN